MNDATNVMMDASATALYGNSTDNQEFRGLPAAIADSGTYGNIDRGTYTWWKSKAYAAGGANPTRQNVLQYIVGTIKNGAEKPSFGVMGMGTWVQLAQDFVSQESYQITPGSSFAGADADGPSAAFTALMVGGVPIYADPYMPEGTLYLVNSNYMGFYIHDQGSFVFTGFESTLPNYQIGYIGAVLLIAELVSVKPRSMSVVTGYNYATV